MPGPASAALAAYPQFAGPNAKIARPAQGGVFTGVYCAGNDGAFDFQANILTEVAGLLPGKYLHIGGAEVNQRDWKNCPDCQARIKTEGQKDERELQAYFTGRSEKIVNAPGKPVAAAVKRITHLGTARTRTIWNSWRFTGFCQVTRARKMVWRRDLHKRRRQRTHWKI